MKPLPSKFSMCHGSAISLPLSTIKPLYKANLIVVKGTKRKCDACGYFGAVDAADNAVDTDVDPGPLVRINREC
jgi:hypothetical protein